MNVIAHWETISNELERSSQDHRHEDTSIGPAPSGDIRHQRIKYKSENDNHRSFGHQNVSNIYSPPLRVQQPQPQDESDG